MKSKSSNQFIIIKKFWVVNVFSDIQPNSQEVHHEFANAAQCVLKGTSRSVLRAILIRQKGKKKKIA